MLTGIVNQESLPQLLQSIAQRRKQGDLEITLIDSVAKLSFIQGKLVEYNDGSVIPAQEVYGLLKRAGVVRAEPDFDGTNYSDLLKFADDHWAGQGAAADTVRSAVKKRLLDRLHQFDFDGTVPWGFRVGGVDVDRSIATGISVSQLLLDWSEVDAVADQFSLACSPDTILARSKNFSGTTGPNEISLLAHLEVPRTVGDLEERTFLDTLAFRQAVLKLLETGAVTQQSPAPTEAPVQIKNEQPPIEAPKVTVAPAAVEKPKKVRKFKAKKEATSDSIPQILALVMLISAIVLPFFFWQEAFTQF